MKRFAAALLVLLAAEGAQAQMKTLISGEVEHGGFGGPVVKASQVMGNSAVFVGGRGGWIVNHRYVLGGGGYGMASRMDARGEAEAFYLDEDGMREDLTLQFGYGGVEFEWIGRPDNLIHYSFYTLIGAGGVTYVEKDDDNGRNDRHDSDRSDAVFVMEPAVNGEINVTEWFRIALGVSYRHVTDVDLVGVDDADLSGVSGALTFKFGKF